MKKIRVLQFGLGNMGSMMAKIILEKKDLELVGAVIRNSNDNRKDICEIIKIKNKTGIKCFINIDEAVRKTKPDIMLHAAVSYVPEVWKQIKPAISKGVSVITIAEEMGYPFVKYPKICREMDKIAKKNNAKILGSGINPGFAMDIFPLMISGICDRVDSIKITRYIDFSPFGRAIQQNIGIGMNLKEFEQGVKSGKLPLHIGLPESAHMLASALGWKINKIIEKRDPVISNKKIFIKNYKTILPGKIAGFNHRCFAKIKNKTKITLEELGRVEPNFDYRNIINIKGIPNITEWMNVPPGHITTTSHAVNLIPKVYNSTKKGLLTMLDILPAYALANKK